MNADNFRKTLDSINLRKLAKTSSLFKWLGRKNCVSVDNPHFAAWMFCEKILWLLYSCSALWAINMKQIMFITIQYTNFSSGGN